MAVGAVFWNAPRVTASNSWYQIRRCSNLTKKMLEPQLIMLLFSTPPGKQTINKEDLPEVDEEVKFELESWASGV
ncbi:hypothetical protein PPTG_24242 [Phytophthora nicotianae INRA-310]|uniref:Uncharacterized protein n=2 Tax=Phytophthora nicotianae TaxID=4792 RepID=W2PJ04_PHYN3|nr:hypothetical protein PPTG_24242 [Phytophthora nicotianae INRA-310]ETN00621.1 hypothetical protein PPTG_24242 [Phytophthora nicotianae INRA-310]ETO61992.1 hypothetical protein F444_20050 [Phytophthora nicotianae P1976]